MGAFSFLRSNGKRKRSDFVDLRGFQEILVNIRRIHENSVLLPQG
jgi:hypothetical protein